MEKEQNNMSRRRFLQVGGSIMLGAAFAGVMGRSLWKMLTNPADIFYDGKEAKRMKDEDKRQAEAERLSNPPYSSSQASKPSSSPSRKAPPRGLPPKPKAGKP